MPKRAKVRGARDPVLTMADRCGCKGIRSCLLCEDSKGKSENSSVKHDQTSTEVYIYCVDCHKAWRQSSDQGHPHHTDACVEFPGILLLTDFLSHEEEITLASTIDSTPWMESQSGRRKQDYGPKVNFKKKKLRLDCFSGLPLFSRQLVDRFRRHKLLQDFVPVELCNLEYTPERGSAIDAHFDDFWLWGERLVTVNILSDTFLSMSSEAVPNVMVNVPMPRRSLIVLYGPARYEWKHAILRTNIRGRRLAVTFRELTPEFLAGGSNEELGVVVTQLASTFDGKAVGTLQQHPQ